MIYYTVQLITFGKVQKGNNQCKRPLCFLMLLMSLYLVINAARYLGYDNFFKYGYVIQLPILLAIIPTYFLYLRAVLEPSNILLTKPLRDYLPSIFILLLNIVAMSNLSADQIDLFLSSKSTLSNINDNTIRFASIVFLLGNVGFITLQFFTTMYQYIRIIGKLSDIRKHDITYLPHFQILWSHITLVSVIVFLILCSLMNLITPSFNSSLSSVINIGLLIAGGTVGYFGLRQYKLSEEVNKITTKELSIDNLHNSEITFENEYNEIISYEESVEITSKLKHCLVNDKPYLNKDIGIAELAKQIDTNKRKLTYVIHNVMETNFYGIMNKYRVLETKEMLKRPQYQKYNIDIISKMAGFQSKSSFNACFKKMTGQTPSEFRKNSLMK